MDTKEPRIVDLLTEAHINLERQGPGSREAVLRALDYVGNKENIKNAADLGCGSGGQTMILAENLKANITGLDIFESMVSKLNENARNRGLYPRVQGVAGDMANPPFEEESLDLIWSEGAIDNIGFEEGVGYWRKFLKKGGYIAVTCPCRLAENCPEEVEKFWSDAGSRLYSPDENIKAMTKFGYRFIAAFALEKECWTDNYFYPRQKAIEALKKKYPGSANMKFYADINRREVELYENYNEYYGYVFFIAKAI